MINTDFMYLVIIFCGFLDTEELKISNDFKGIVGSCLEAVRLTPKKCLQAFKFVHYPPKAYALFVGRLPFALFYAFHLS